MNLKREIDSNTIVVGDINVPLTSMDRLRRQKFSKGTTEFTKTMEQMYPTDIYRAIHPKAQNTLFFSSVPGTFSRTDHIIGHKTSLSKLKKIIPCAFSDHDEGQLETSKSKYSRKCVHSQKLNLTQLKEQ